MKPYGVVTALRRGVKDFVMSFMDASYLKTTWNMLSKNREVAVWKLVLKTLHYHGWAEISGEGWTERHTHPGERRAVGESFRSFRRRCSRHLDWPVHDCLMGSKHQRHPSARPLEVSLPLEQLTQALKRMKFHNIHFFTVADPTKHIGQFGLQLVFKCSDFNVMRCKKESKQFLRCWCFLHLKCSGLSR